MRRSHCTMVIEVDGDAITMICDSEGQDSIAGVLDL
jgi:hypothetical protein